MANFSLACGGGGGGAGDGGSDAAPDAVVDSAMDSSADTGTVCSVDEDCDDGLFCDGVERCAPTDSGADARGCVAAEAMACDTPEACDEEADRCLTACDLTGDQDGDGHATLACGGDDCDDMDANRYPGNVEICDPGSHDEDCDPLTFGFVDEDMDGVGAIRCCNVAADGSFNCGGDCDDSNGSIHPGAGDGPPAACDGLDNDCDGTTDESCPCTEGETQPCGASPAQIDGVGTCEPGTQICSGGSFTAECVGGRGPQTELCDGLDNDCDGTVDNGVLRTYYTDGDGDGFGVDTATTEACSPPDGWAANTLDCDDTNPAISPVGTEVCDGVDNNCNALTDEGLLRTYYRDADGDGFGDATMTTDACYRPDGYADGATDCDDGAATVNPAATEVCDGADNNCDGATDEGCSCTDGERQPCGADDGAGGILTVGACTAGEQLCAGGLWGVCVGSVTPATEVCNGADDDCDGTVDEGVKTTFYRDGDGDGFGTATTTVDACDAPVGYVRVGTDCDDGASAINPSSVELCDGVDNDCDGTTDEGCSCVDGARQACGTDDGSGGILTVGACTAGEQLCTGGLWGACVGAVGPATEVCNGADDDCDGLVDEGVKTTFYADTDGDGFGDSGSTTAACAEPAGYVRSATDCNDTAAAVNPAAAELCDGADNNCDSVVDEGCSCVDGARQACGASDGAGGILTTGACVAGEQLCTAGLWSSCVGDVRPATESCNGVDDDCDGTVDEGVKTRFYRDMDGDGFGDSTSATQACSEPAGYVRTSTDCDDTAAAINPSSVELCDGVDNDCDGTADEGCSCVDGSRQACGPSDGAGGILTAGACAAGEQLCTGGLWGACVGDVGPATESCNGVDDDCDGSTDEGVKTTYYRDGDGDGFGRASTSVAACTQPTGYVLLSTDCDDGASSVHPGVVELCDGIDNNCDGVVDEGCSCRDGSTRSCGTSDGMGGFLSAGQCVVGSQICIGGAWGSCIGAVGPVRETCNGLDDDCDGSTDEGTTANCYQDGDGDGYGTGALQTVCADARGRCPTGFAPRNGDCNDSNRSIYPGKTEVCNAVDDDCDGSADETFACVQNQIVPCTTACGTSGLHTCDASCAWRETVCSAPTETCNYCDDTGDGSFDDETPIATRSGGTSASCSTSSPDTSVGTHYGSASCYSTSGFPPTNYVRLSNYASTAGALWADRPVRIGYSGFVVEAKIEASDGATYAPGQGWALVITNDTGATLGSSGSALGVPYGRHGIAVEWRFNGNAQDTLRARRLTGSGSGVLLASSAANITPSDQMRFPVRLDEGVSRAEQRIRVTFTPANSYIGTQEALQVEVYDPATDGWSTYIDSARVIGGFSVNSGFAPADQIRVGLVAAGSSTTRARVDAELGYYLATAYHAFRVESNALCVEPEGSLRISGGDGRSGRLEVFHAGEWGTVCDDFFDDTDARVACRQMGFSTGTMLPAASTKDSSKLTTWPTTWMDNVNCTGTESRLDECTFGNGTCGGVTWGCENCDHTEDVGVSCTP